MLSSILCCGYTPLLATNAAISRATHIDAQPAIRTIKVARLPWGHCSALLEPKFQRNFVENQWQWVAPCCGKKTARITRPALVI